MGVPRFFAWLNKTYPHLLLKFSKQLQGVSIDNLCIDANGVFHAACQYVFKYGSHKPKVPQIVNINPKKQQKDAFFYIGKLINEIVYITQPKKRVIIAIDGVAGRGKQSQQRQRRYKSAKTRPDGEFDSNCLSTGTEFMQYLHNYLDYFIRYQMHYSNMWQNLEVIYSNDKVAGEGEHKLIQFMRGIPFEIRNSESWCIHGLDADLIMLALGTKLDKIYIIRENDNDWNGDKFTLIDVGKLSDTLFAVLSWGADSIKCNTINDFIFICFLMGNDFLPHSPSLEILNGGMETLLGLYTDSVKECKSNLITVSSSNGDYVTINKDVFALFLNKIANIEEQLLNHKLNEDKPPKFSDVLMQSHTVEHKSDEDGKRVKRINFKDYRADYYSLKIKEDNVSKVCTEYLKGMQWVITYYLFGIPDWNWCYPYNYAPFATELAENISKFTTVNFNLGTPMRPFQQLLAVLPPRSKYLLPPPLSECLIDPKSKIYEYTIQNLDYLTIDLAGKNAEWEGIVILPQMPRDKVVLDYENNINLVDIKCKGRNSFNYPQLYKRTNSDPYNFKTYYGEIINCTVKLTKLN